MGPPSKNHHLDNPSPLPPHFGAQGYGNKKFVFQGVHETICYGPADKPWGADEPQVNQIVFIGRGLDRKVRRGGHSYQIFSCEWQGWGEGE